MALLLGLGVLASFLFILIAARYPVRPSPEAAAGTTSAAALTGSASSTEVQQLPVTLSTATPTLRVTLIGPQSPADAWANVVLDRLLARLQQPPRPGDGFAWWQSSVAGGPLTYSNSKLWLNQDAFSANDQQAIDLYVVSADDPNQLQHVGGIRLDQGVLTVTALGTKPDEGDGRWLIAGGLPDTAIQALVIQAAARLVVIRMAYSPGPAEGGQLVMLSAQTANQTPSAGSLTPSEKVTPTDSPSAPTPTRPPEADLGVVVESKLKPVIEAGLAFPANVIDSFTATHAWSGPLTWSESGPQVDQRPIHVAVATQLTFLILTPNDPRGPTQPFLTAEYTGNVTRFPDEQVYFQGQRMNEIVYWFVYYSAQHGGQLVVGYDDFGDRQAMTIIGFNRFSQPSP